MISRVQMHKHKNENYKQASGKIRNTPIEMIKIRTEETHCKTMLGMVRCAKGRAECAYAMVLYLFESL